MSDPSRSTTPQLENGYTKLADELLEAICRAHLGGRELAVLLALVRLTYGWGKKRDRIAASQLAKLTHIPRPKIPAILRSLEAKRLIKIEKSGQGRIPTLSILKDHRKWPKRSRPAASPKKGARSSPKKGASAAPQLAPVLGSTSPIQGGRTSPLYGAHHRERDNNQREGGRIAFGKLKPKLSEKKVERLIAIKPKAVTYTADEVQAWFLMKEPKMIDRGVKNTLRAAGNWWGRVTVAEVREAVLWCESQAMTSVALMEDTREKDSLADFAEAFNL